LYKSTINYRADKCLEISKWTDTHKLRLQIRTSNETSTKDFSHSHITQINRARTDGLFSKVDGADMGKENPISILLPRELSPETCKSQCAQADTNQFEIIW
jgi:hypothetical protein